MAGEQSTRTSSKRRRKPHVEQRTREGRPGRRRQRARWRPRWSAEPPGCTAAIFCLEDGQNGLCRARERFPGQGRVRGKRVGCLQVRFRAKFAVNSVQTRWLVDSLLAGPAPRPPPPPHLPASPGLAPAPTLRSTTVSCTARERGGLPRLVPSSTPERLGLGAAVIAHPLSFCPPVSQRCRSQARARCSIGRTGRRREGWRARGHARVAGAKGRVLLIFA